MQSSLARQSRTLQKQLKDRDSEVSRLQSELDDLSSRLANAQSETKALQTRLSASRNAAIGADGGQVKPTGAGKGASSRNAGTGGAEATLSAQVAQLKEDLYSDLTGLIVRDVKRQDAQQLYDCIQTGLNGSKCHQQKEKHQSQLHDHMLIVTALQRYISNSQSLTARPAMRKPSSTILRSWMTTVTGSSWTFCLSTSGSTLLFRGSTQRGSTAAL